MAKQKPTAHQLAVYQARLDRLDQAWLVHQQSFVVHGIRPTWIQAGLSFLMAVSGLFCLVWALRLLCAGESVLRLVLVWGLVAPTLGGYFAIVFAVQTYRLATAERSYRRRRGEVSIEDCPKDLERNPAGDRLAAQEDAAGAYLLDLD
jgi:hypothetical protein